MLSVGPGLGLVMSTDTIVGSVCLMVGPEDWADELRVLVSLGVIFDLSGFWQTLLR